MNPTPPLPASRFGLKINSKFESRNSEITNPKSKIKNQKFPVLAFLLFCFAVATASAQEPKDANVAPRAPKAEFVNPPSPEAVAANTPAATPSTLPAEKPKSGDLLASASAKAQSDLDAALKELTATREKIAGEKVPLSQALTKAEDELAIARKQLETAQRTRDLRNLDQTSLKTEIKQREEENMYMLNLLNEFGRNFGDKGLHISERKGHREKLDLAKAAHENTTTSREDKYQHSFAVVEAALTRLEDLMGGVTYSGVALDAKGGLVEGKFALVGPMVLFSNPDGSVAGFASEAKGSKEPVVKGAEHSKIFGQSFAALTSGQEGVIPSDFTMGQALRNLSNKNSIVRTFIHGGPIMWPMLFVAIAAVIVSLERTLFIFMENRRRNESQVEQIFSLVEKGDRPGAIRIAETSTDYVARVLGFALAHAELSISQAISKASALEIQRFTRGLPILDTIITAAPLLGLLGTVVGMMNTFSMMGGDELGAPAAITGGIAEGLIATAFGLLIAIACLFPNSYLNAKVETVQHQVDDAGRRLDLLLLAQKSFHGAGGHSSPPHGSPPPSSPPAFTPAPMPMPPPAPTPRPVSAPMPAPPPTPAPKPSAVAPPPPHAVPAPQPIPALPTSLPSAPAVGKARSFVTPAAPAPQPTVVAKKKSGLPNLLGFLKPKAPRPAGPAPGAA
jgi:biopolymer transport protein ExbB